MKIVLFILMFLAGQVGFSQSEPSYPAMSVDILSPINFNYSSYQDLFQPKIISNALKLNVKVKNENCRVYCQVVFNDAVAATPYADKLSLKFRNTNSSNANATPDVKLSTAPTLILVQPGGFTDVQSFEYFYDLVLDPPTEFQKNPVSGFSLVYTIATE